MRAEWHQARVKPRKIVSDFHTEKRSFSHSVKCHKREREEAEKGAIGVAVRLQCRSPRPLWGLTTTTTRAPESCKDARRRIW